MHTEVREEFSLLFSIIIVKINFEENKAILIKKIQPKNKNVYAKLRRKR